ncbi:unnamed protein product [Rotaria sordida]|uniref:Uncharacterized protein n=1 Tax=Rotaria sordida TaxID=392033 RepID=A0A814TMX7_9BILA|nr:unnamed protein product [Rotaria sordida]CAF1412888.1 unnamed protein product [Rotaria sordida]
MATATPPTATGIARGSSLHSSLGTVAPLNTPTRRFYGSQDQVGVQPLGVPNPNIYVVQPFKNASIPKDYVYAKKNAPNPGENLLNSTIDLINHFTSCYEAVKHQLQDEHIKEREILLNSRSMTVTGTNNTVSRNGLHRPAKQARLRPLIQHQTQQTREGDQEPSIENCIGISPIPVTKADDLVKVYDEKLRLLRKLKPEFFDSQGNLISRNPQRAYSYSQASIPSSKKSTVSSFRTPYNTLLTGENIPFDDRRTFLTEFANEEEDNDKNNEDEQKLTPVMSTQQTNSLNEIMKNNYVLKVLEIKTMSSATSKRDRTKSASDKGSYYPYKGNATAKTT